MAAAVATAAAVVDTVVAVAAAVRAALVARAAARSAVNPDQRATIGWRAPTRPFNNGLVFLSKNRL